jgi:hypothetical protein
MLPPEIASEIVTRLRGIAGTDSHNNAWTDWDNPATATISGCSVQPLIGDEFNLGRESVTSRWNLWAPVDADLRSSDRIRHNGIDYEVDGSVQKWTDTTGNGWDHLFAILKRVEG